MYIGTNIEQTRDFTRQIVLDFRETLDFVS